MKKDWKDIFKGVLVAAVCILWLVCAVWYLRQRKKG